MDVLSAPTVVAPILDVNVSEDAPDSIIDLSNVFDDPAGDNASITKTAVSSDVSLVKVEVVGDTLTLSYEANQSGVTTIMVTALANGMTVDDNVTVTVNPVDDAPTLVNPIFDLNASEDSGDLSISLANVFNDIDDDNASIVKTSPANTNPSLVTATVAGDDLTLDFQPDQFGSATITVRGTSNGEFADDNFKVTVAPVDDPPVVATPIPDVNASEDDPDLLLSLANVFNDIDDDNASIVKTSPANTNPALVTATVAGDELILDFQPDQFGTAIVTIRGTSNGEFADDNFTVTVAPVDDPPIVATPIPDVNASEDDPDLVLSLANVFNDVDDDNASIVKTSLANTNPGLVTATVAGDELTLDFQPDQFGTAIVTIRGTSNGKTADDSFEVTVAPVDDAPVVTNVISNVFADEDDPDFAFSLTNLFNDIDDDNASIVKTSHANTNPGLVAATVAGDELTLDFQPNQFGTATITVRGTSNGKTSDDSFEVTVAPVDDAPAVTNTISDVNASEDAPDLVLSLTNVFNDIDDDNASIVKTSLANTNPGLVTVTVAGDELTLDFQPEQFGNATITVRGTSNGKTADDSFEVAVAPVDDAPVVTNLISNVFADEDDPDFVLSLTNVFNDVDDDNASIAKTSHANTNPGLVTVTLVGNDLTLDFQPNQFGTATITVRGTSNGKAADDSFEVTVAPVDDAPVVANTISDVNASEDDPDLVLSLTNVFYDIDDDGSIVKTSLANTNPTLVTSILAGDGLTLDFQPNQFGNATITVRGTSNGKTADDSFEVTIAPVDDAPVVVTCS